MRVLKGTSKEQRPVLYQVQGIACISFLSFPLLEEKVHLIFPPIQRRDWSSVWLQLAENGVCVGGVGKVKFSIDVWYLCKVPQSVTS